MKTSIIIPTNNGGKSLGECLKSIRGQSYDSGFEVIIVDSGSSDNTLETAERYGVRITRIPPKTFTHGGARNLGASLSCGEYLVFCNQDVVPADDQWLSRLTAPLSQGWIGAAYSRQIPPGSTPLYERVFLRHLYPPESRTNTIEMLRNRGPAEVVLFSTVSGAMRKEVWRRFRFDEHIIMSEDQEIACRMLLQGYKIAYRSDSCVYHSNRYSLSNAFRRYFDSGWSIAYIPLLRLHSVGKSLHYLTAQCKEILQQSDTTVSERMSALRFLTAKGLGFGLGQLAPLMPETIRVRASHTKRIVS